MTSYHVWLVMELLESLLWVTLGFASTYAGLEVAFKEVFMKKKAIEAAIH